MKTTLLTPSTPLTPLPVWLLSSGDTGVIGATVAFGPDGTLYQNSAIFDDVGFVAGYLNTLDPDTGAVLTTSDPFTQAHVGGLAVRPTDGVIFASGGDAGRHLHPLADGHTDIRRFDECRWCRRPRLHTTADEQGRLQEWRMAEVQLPI